MFYQVLNINSHLYREKHKNQVGLMIFENGHYCNSGLMQFRNNDHTNLVGANKRKSKFRRSLAMIIEVFCRLCFDVRCGHQHLCYFNNIS